MFRRSKRLLLNKVNVTQREKEAIKREEAEFLQEATSNDFSQTQQYSTYSYLNENVDTSVGGQAIEEHLASNQRFFNRAPLFFNRVLDFFVISKNANNNK